MKFGERIPKFLLKETRYVFPVTQYLQDKQVNWREQKLLPFVIMERHKPIGFFALSLDTQEIREALSKGRQACVLENFLIVSKEQRKGFATRTLRDLHSIAKSHLPGVSHVYLTVNIRNIRAEQLYLKNGFRDTKRLYLEGIAGPQKIFELEL